MMVTHDNDLAARAQRIVALADGEIVDEVNQTEPLKET
jgi:predicted ABC-type transport system involved in lysophospholipase L1 biosynthesis ATPase subunit